MSCRVTFERINGELDVPVWRVFDCDDILRISTFNALTMQIAMRALTQKIHHADNCCYSRREKA